MAQDIRCCHGKKCPSDARVDGKTIIVTGGNTGIGKETARELAARGGKVILGCRSAERAQEAVDDITQSLANKPDAGSVSFKRLDLASFASIREFAKNILDSEDRVDILINNAGIMACPEWKTEDGFEMQFGVNHLGHFLLTMLLMNKLKQSAPSRIVTVSSLVHQWGKIKFDDINSEENYSPFWAYCHSKLANVLFARELARRLQGTGVTTYSLHPGAINTELQRHSESYLTQAGSFVFSKLMSPFMKNPTEGAQTTIYCAVAEECKDQSGLYYSGCKVTEPSSRAKKDDTALKLFELSCQLADIQSPV